MEDKDENTNLSRRIFVQRFSFFGGGTVLLGSACEEKPKSVPNAKPILESSHRTFTNEEFEVLSAACERIMPHDEDPGAIGVGVPEYIDGILQTKQLEKMRDDFVPGILALNRRSVGLFGTSFAKAKPEQQDELLHIFQTSGPKTGESHFFELLTVLTLEGFFSDPSYGGNRNQEGWKLIGFDLVKHEKADPTEKYQGEKHLNDLKCGHGKGC